MRREQSLVIATLTPDSGCALPGRQQQPRAGICLPAPLPSHPRDAHGGQSAAPTLLYHESTKKQHLDLPHLKLL